MIEQAVVQLEPLLGTLPACRTRRRVPRVDLPMADPAAGPAAQTAGRLAAGTV